MPACQEHLIIIVIILIVVTVVVMVVIFLKYLFFLTQLKMVLIMRYIIIIVLLLLFGWLVVCITTEKANKIGQEWNLQKENFIFLSQLSTFCVLKGVKGRLDVQFNWLWRPRLLTERTSSYRVLSQGDDFHFLNFFANTIPQVLTDFSTMICQL